MHKILQYLRQLPLPGSGKGRYFETIAAAYLRRQGLKIVHFNFRSRHGEIDLIAQHGDVLVFVEVRYRRDAGHGSAAATVDLRKQHKIILTAQYFLQKYGLTNRMPCRFDVIAITGSYDATDIRWIKNAFQKVYNGGIS